MIRAGQASLLSLCLGFSSYTRLVLVSKVEATLRRFITLALAFLFSVVPVLAHAVSVGPKLECPVVMPIIQGFLTNHLSYKKVDPEIERRTIEQFINKLDPSKVYLSKSDVEQMQGWMKGVFGKLGRDCAPISLSHQRLVQRLKESEAFARSALGDSYKFVESTELLIDPKLREWPSSEEEQHKQMMKFIHFQISNYVASDMKLPQARKQLTHRYELNAKRQAELRQDELYSVFLDAFATALDSHSGYLAKDMLEDFEISMRLSLEGIGAALTWEDGYTTVENLIPGGAAERSGEVQPKDKIIAVAQGEKPFEQVIDMPLRDVVRLIRGPKGSTVRLTLLRQGAKETSRHIVVLKRDKINLQDEAAKLVYTTRKEGDRTLKIAVLDLPSFYGDLTRKTRSCYEDLKKLIEQAAREKADGIVLDLSRNGGGLLSEAVRIAGLFIKKGNVVATQDGRQKLDLLADDEPSVEWKGPLVVLTSRLSASASEIVSGALQDYKRAVIVGADHTFGKGTVQAMMNLPGDLGAIKVTTGMFFIPGGSSTQQRGVPADIVVPSLFSTKDVGEKGLDYSLPPKSIAAFTSAEVNEMPPAGEWKPVQPDVIKKLKALSEGRLSNDAEFKKIRTELAEIEAKKGVINLSQSLKKQKEEKAKDAKKPTAGRKRRQSDEDYLKVPQVNEAVNVLVDQIRLMGPSAQVAGTSGS